MALYYLSYDLVKRKDYPRLYEELNTFNAVRVLESVWYFNRFNTTAANLINYFGQFIDQDDRLIVIEAKDWAGLRLKSDPNKL